MFGLERVLSRPHLGHGGVEGGPPLVELSPLMLVHQAIGFQILAQQAGRFELLSQLRCRHFVLGPLVGESLFLTANLLARPLQAGAQGGQHRLLAFQRGGALIELGADGLVLLLLRRQEIGPRRLPRVPIVQLSGLLFEFPAFALQLLEAPVDLESLFLQLRLAQVERGLDAIEPDEIGLVLVLSLGKLDPFHGESLLASADLFEPLGQLPLVFLLLTRQEAMLFFEQFPFAAILFIAGLEGTFAIRQFLDFPGQAFFGGVKKTFAMLHLLGRTADGDLAGCQAIAALTIALEQLFSNGTQLAAQSHDLFVLLGKGGGVDAQPVPVPAARASRAFSRASRWS